jgi:hypothetical protein
VLSFTNAKGQQPLSCCSTLDDIMSLAMTWAATLPPIICLICQLVAAADQPNTQLLQNQSEFLAALWEHVQPGRKQYHTMAVMSYSIITSQGLYNM